MYEALELIQHESFRNRSNDTEGAYPHDIGLIRLSTAVELSDTVQPIALDVEETGSDCYISGWGRTGGLIFFTNVDSCYKLVYYSYISIHLDGILLPETLREAPVDILSDEQADSAWGDSYNGNIHICVQDLDDFVYGACNVGIVTWTYAYK